MKLCGISSIFVVKSVSIADGGTFVCDEVCDALPLKNETHNYIHIYIYIKTNLFQNEIHQHTFF